MIPTAHLQAMLQLLEAKGETTICAISGNCMAPMLREGDSLLIAYGNSHIHVGDLVVFGSPGDLCVHRVIRVESAEGMDTFIVKGDSSITGHVPVSRDHILGKVVEVRGKNGHIRLESAVWQIAKQLLWLRSYISIRRLQADSGFWRATNAVFRLLARFFPKQRLVGLLPIRAMCWFNRMRPVTIFSHRGRKVKG